MTILDLISSETNLIFKKKSSKEWGGPCFMPGCGGVDRFSILPDQDKFICRKCRVVGDSITFIMKFHNKTYFQACTQLNITPNIQYKSLNSATEKPNQNEIVWKPREITYPNNQWQTKAEAFLFESYKFLLSKSGKSYRHWLNKRGINNDTIKKNRIGYNRSNINFSLESWGLIPEKPKTNKKEGVWLPEGLLLPTWMDKKLIGLRIRRFEPDIQNRFVVVTGSYSGPIDHDEVDGLS